MLLEVALQGLSFLLRWWAGKKTAEQLVYRVLARLMHKFASFPGKLDVHFIIEKGEGLQRGIAAVPFGEAVFSRSSIKGHEAGKGSRPLDKSIDGATEAVFSFGNIPGLITESMGEHSFGLGWVNPRSVHLGGEFPAGMKHMITD